MLYKFNKNSLNFEKTSKFRLVLRPILITAIITGIFGYTVRQENKDRIPEEQKLIVLQEANRFSEERLVEEIAGLNFRFPHIVLAQAKLESNNFRSYLFKENNNMFGMKLASSRLTLAKGSEHGYAAYENWTESLMDYALYYSSYLKNVRTEREYYQFLSKFYAEDITYVEKVQNLIIKEQLKSKF
jgi:hypothetical protein